MPVMGLGKLVLKGGEEVKGVSKKKVRKKKTDPASAEAVAATTEDGDAGEPDQPSTSGAAEADTGAAKLPPPKLEYEKEFKFETARMEEGKARSTAWGATYRAPPEILHGYRKKVVGETYEERLDLRCAKKADRMCK